MCPPVVVKDCNYLIRGRVIGFKTMSRDIQPVSCYLLCTLLNVVLLCTL